MTVPTIVAQLAFQAMTDPDALPPLGDAVQESGWFDPRQLFYRRSDLDSRGKRVVFPHVAAHYAARPNTAWAKGIAALALCESWPTNALDWPTVARCLRPYPQGRSEAFEARAGFYGQMTIAQPAQNFALNFEEE